jgi:hypothetical protein
LEVVMCSKGVSEQSKGRKKQEMIHARELVHNKLRKGQ